jgi:hypothetical protein
MKPTAFLFALTLICVPASADRISEMSRTERCVYTARLEVIAYHFFKQGKPREEINLHWKGDETQNEIDFVNGILDEAYAWLVALGTDANRLSDQAFGDMVYEACVSGRPL